MMIYLIAFLSIVVIYVLFLTPYPFVWLLRSKKGKSRNKSPDNIEEIKDRVFIQKNLPYPSIYPQATYDLYLPKNKSVENIIVWVHGGFFVTGTSSGMRNYGPMLASQGYAVCAMNYAYSPRHAFPTQIRQVDEVICCVVNKLEKEGFHIKGIILGGDSAGANIAASYGTLNQNESLKQKINISFNNTVPLKAMLLFCGPYDFCEDINKKEFKAYRSISKYIGWSYLGHKSWLKRKEKYYASPMHNIHSQFPPCYIIDGKKQSFAWQGEKFAALLTKHNIFVKKHFYDDMPHEFQFDYQRYSNEAMEVYRESISFLETVLYEKKES